VIFLAPTVGLVPLQDRKRAATTDYALKPSENSGQNGKFVVPVAVAVVLAVVLDRLKSNVEDV
jgi:hypothetical protein